MTQPTGTWEDKVHHILSMAWSRGWTKGMERELNGCYVGTEESTRKMMVIIRSLLETISEEIGDRAYDHEYCDNCHFFAGLSQAQEIIKKHMGEKV